jgi:MFS family permease
LIDSRYGPFLRTPYVRPLLACAVLARLPVGINSLAIVLLLQAQTGSFGVAGLVVAALSVGSCVGAPLQGRLVDRRGPRRVLPPLSLVHAGGLGGVVALVFAGAPTPWVMLSAFVGGAALPPISSVTRSLWPSLLRGDARMTSAAFALDSVLIELVFVAGPALTAAIAVWAGPAFALLVSGAAVVTGTAFFTTLQPIRSMVAQVRARPGPLGALASPGMRTLALVTLPIGFCFGAAEITLPAYGEHHGAAALGGLLLAVHALGSAAGGLLYGARERRRPLRDSYVRLAALLPLGFLPLAVASPIPAMAVLLFAAGAVIAPLLATGYQMVADVAPSGTATEAYTWSVTSLVAGIAAGSAATGLLMESASWQAGFAVATTAAGVAAAVAFVRRSTLAPIPALAR